MVVSSLKRYGFYTFFILSHASPLLIPSTWAMEEEILVNEKSPAKSLARPQDPTDHLQQKTPCLMTAIEAFLANQWDQAASMFLELRAGGAIVAQAYLEHLIKNKLLKNAISVDDREFVEPIPEVGNKLGEQHLKASLIYMDCLDQSKSKQIKNNVKKLAPLVLNGNAHAIRLCKNNQKIFDLLKTEKQFKALKSPDDLYQKFRLDPNGPMQFCNFLDPEHLLFLYDNRKTEYVKKINCFSEPELKFFSDKYRKKDPPIGDIAMELANNSKNQNGFWAYLAVENGKNGGCLLLGRLFYEKLQIDSSQSFNNTQKIYLEFSRYYTSHIHKISPLDRHVATTLLKGHAYSYFSGQYGEINNIKDRFYTKKAADLGDSEAQYNYALACRDGKGPEKNLEEALKYFKLATDQGNDEAEYNYAVMLVDRGRKVLKETEGQEFKEEHLNDVLDAKEDLKEALKHFKNTADKGLEDAKKAYILLCNEVESDLKDWLYLQNFADQGDPDAQFKYAAICLKKMDLNTARKYFGMAAGQNNKYSQLNYAAMLYNGNGGEKDFPGALKNFQNAADQGLLWAQYNTAVMLYRGEGGGKNLIESLRYCKMAVDQGDENSIILFYILDAELNPKIETISHFNHKVSQQDPEKENQNEDVEITLPSLEEDQAGSSDDEKETVIIESPHIPALDVSQEASLPQKDAITESIVLTEDPDQQAERKREKEIHQLTQENARRFSEFRVKKQLQKEAAARTRHILTVKRKDYDQTCESFGMKEKAFGRTPKSKVAYETLEFVKAIFGQGKINTFSNTAAQKAFADLGCIVKNKKGENSTLLSFNLERGREMRLEYEKGYEKLNEEQDGKLKYHNPHGHGDNNLYNALKPHLKRFLQSINKAPETLEVK